MFLLIRIGRCRAQRFALCFRLRDGDNSSAIGGDRQRDGFPVCQWASAPVDLLTDDFVDLSIAEDPWGQNDIGTPIGFIDDSVLDIRSFHGSWNFFGAMMAVKDLQPFDELRFGRRCRRVASRLRG